jgi:MOSC domain-containing protein YiiM
MAHITAVCVGDIKGGPKRRVGQAQLARNFGLSGDADAGPHGRQVTLMNQSDFLSMSANQEILRYGATGENLVIEGLNLRTVKPGSTLRCGDALLEFVGPIAGCPLFEAKARLAGIITEGDQILVESSPS